MSEQPTYLVTVTVNNSIIAQYGISVPNRKTAVRKMLKRVADEYKGKYGLASEILTVSDPNKEVVYTESWNCNDTGNNYLDETTLKRVIEKSEGILERDSKIGSLHHPRRSTRRKERRREYRVTVSPNIQESNTGIFYYRIILTPQKSRRGVILVKRKMKEEKLKAKTLPEAIEEIQITGLKKINERNTARKNGKVRSIKLLWHLAGIRPLQGDDLEYFSPVLKNRKMPKPGMGEGSTV